MENKLELKHLAPYLPYGLKVSQHREDLDKDFESNVVGLRNETVKVTSTRFPFSEDVQYYEIKPILRPLSDLTKEIEVNGSVFNPIETYVFYSDEINSIVGLNKIMIHDPCGLVRLLFKWHFDVFGLIEKGLAIDKNTIANENQ